MKEFERALEALVRYVQAKKTTSTLTDAGIAIVDKRYRLYGKIDGKKLGVMTNLTQIVESDMEAMREKFAKAFGLEVEEICISRA